MPFIMLLHNLEVNWLLDVGFGVIRLSSVHGTFSTSHSVAWKEASAGISPGVEHHEQDELTAK